MSTLSFLGAARQVTGSSYLIEVAGHRVLLECGMLQGRDKSDDELSDGFEFDPRQLDAVVISHTHLDHSGLAPLLVKQGYRGPIHTTSATRDLLPIMYRDAASLMLSDIERKNRRLRRAGRPLQEPPYDLQDVEQALQQLVGVDYGRRQRLLSGVEVRFRDAGHVLGSAIVELWLGEGQTVRKLVFSGDLGNSCAPLMRDPSLVDEADVLLLESTYGDRNHRPLEQTIEELRSVLDEAAQSGGNILIPSFAVGRTQDLIYWLGRLHQEGGLQRQRVYIDSPMAIQVSEVYERHQNLFNEDDPDFRRFVRQGWDEWLPGLTYTMNPDESMALNRISEGAIVIAGSGMCTGGRILHHLKHNLWRHKTQVVIVGYQAQGTLGRALVDGAQMVRIFGNDIAVKARIHTLGGFSAHAGQDQLLAWARHFGTPRPRLYLVHGEPEAMEALQRRFALSQGWEAHIPDQGGVVEL
jgi:metallo-beta-lactamase family protein